MRAKFKPLAGQVIVVTGAASGLGLETARLAAKAGAAVVLAAGDEPAVRRACDEIGKAGGRAHPVVADLAADEGCERVARAAVARFGRIDSWVEAGGEAAVLAHAAQALVRHIGTGEHRGALVGFGQRFGKVARAELRAAKGQVAATLIKLPKDWRHDSPANAAAKAALEALTRPVGQLTVAANGKGLTAATQVKKHPVIVVGAGLLALAGVALWFGRGKVLRVALAAGPKVARAVRPLLIGAVKRRPLRMAKLAVNHPRAAMKMARVLR